MDFPYTDDKFDFSDNGPLGAINREHRPAAALAVYDIYLNEAKRRAVAQKLIGRHSLEKNWALIYSWVDTIGGYLK